MERKSPRRMQCAQIFSDAYSSRAKHRTFCCVTTCLATSPPAGLCVYASEHRFMRLCVPDFRSIFEKTGGSGTKLVRRRHSHSPWEWSGVMVSRHRLHHFSICTLQFAICNPPPLTPEPCPRTLPNSSLRTKTNPAIFLSRAHLQPSCSPQLTAVQSLPPPPLAASFSGPPWRKVRVWSNPASLGEWSPESAGR